MSQNLIQNQKLSEELQQYVINGGILKCEEFHAGSCVVDALKRFLIICNNSYKYFIPIYLIPFLLFQRRRFKQKQAFQQRSPGPVIKKLIFEFCGSVIFVGGYIASCKYIFCKLRTWNFNNIWSISLAGFFSSVFLFCEKVSRRAEITLFTSPRVLETLWKMLAKRGWVTNIDYWEFLAFGLAMGIINYHYINNPDQIKHSYRSVYQKLWN